MDPLQPNQPPTDPNAPMGAAAKYTREQWLDMQEKAVAEGNLDAAKYFQQMASEWKTTDKERSQHNDQLYTDMDALERENPWSLGNIIGAGVEPDLTMLSGAVTTPVAGLFGIGKGAVINPLMRAAGGHPNPASNLVESIQEHGTWRPITKGGQTALGAIGAPWQAVHDYISAPSGQAVEESLAKEGAPGSAAALGTLAEVAPDAVAQLFGGELLGRGTQWGRNTLADAARYRNFPKTADFLERKPISPRVEELARVGVVTSPGQRWSQSDRWFLKQLSRIEEALMRNPFTGGIIRDARERSVAQMNYGQLNDSRTPMGLKPIRFDEMSPEDAIVRTNDDLNDAYDILLPRLRGDAHMPVDASQLHIPKGVHNWALIEGAEAKFMADKYGWPGAEEHSITPEERAQVRAQLGIGPNDPVIDPSSAPALSVSPGTGSSFIDLMSDIATTARDGKKGKSDFIRLTTEADKTTLANLIEAIHNRMSEPERLPDGTMSVGGTFDGYDLKTISKWISSAKKAAQAAKKQGSLSGQLVPYLDRLQESFRAMINASNPGDALELQKHDMAWSQLKLVEDMWTARQSGETKPYFSPAAGKAAVRRKALSKPEGRTLLARGQAQGQPLADAAERVLGNKIRGESPTAEVLTALGETTTDALSADPKGILGGGLAFFLGNILGQRFFYSPGVMQWMQNNYLRGHANLPFTDVPAGGAFTRGLPTAIGGEERARETADERMRQQLMELGVNPDAVPR